MSEKDPNQIHHADHVYGHDQDNETFFKQLLESKNDIVNGVVTEEQLAHYCKQLGLETGSKSEMQVKILAAITDKLMSSLAQPKKLKLSVSHHIEDFLINLQARNFFGSQTHSFDRY